MLLFCSLPQQIINSPSKVDQTSNTGVERLYWGVKPIAMIHIGSNFNAGWSFGLMWALGHETGDPFCDCGIYDGAQISE